MAVIQKNGLLQYIDDSGNVYVLYPVTTLDNVSGTGKLLLSDDGKKIKTLDGTEINLTAADHTHAEYAPAYTYGTDNIEAGTPSPHPTGTLHFVYEPAG